MKNILRRFILLVTGILACAYFSMPVFGQSPENDFTSDLYRESIQDIVEGSEGRHDRESVLGILTNQYIKPSQLSLVLVEDTVWMWPEINVVDFDETTVEFDFDFITSAPDTTFDLNFSANTGWIEEGTVDIDTETKKINFEIEENFSFEPRQTEVELIMTSVTPTVSYTANLLQKPQPQQFIMVSPKYQAMAPEGGTTDPFTVTHFNIDEWEAVIDAQDTWLNVDDQALNTITFSVENNSTNLSREATVIIQETGNPGVSDELTIFQYVDTSAYIIVSPANNFIGSGATAVTVSVVSNTDWQLIYDSNPDGMLTDSTVTVDEVVFNVAENTASSRTAIITVKGITYPEVSAEIQITQAAQSPAYLYVSPENSYVGSEADAVLLNIDASVNWDYEIIDNPGNMMSYSNSTTNSITFNISDNNQSVSRTAIGRIKASDGSMLADTFNIIQLASYILLNPESKLLPCEEASFSINVTRYNVDDISISRQGNFSLAYIINNDSVFVDVEANPYSSARIDTIVVCSSTNSIICDTVLVFQYACSQSYLFINPGVRPVLYQGGPTEPFTILSSNVTEWEVRIDPPQNWINDTIIAGDLLSFVTDANESMSPRQATFRVQSVSDTTIFDTATIFQDGAPSPFLLVSPQEQKVAHTGNDDLIFDVTAVNIIGWNVDTSGLQNWVHINTQPQADQFSLTVDTNYTLVTRTDTVWVRATDNPDIKDSVIIYQYSNQDHYLLAAPREQETDYQEAMLNFDVTVVNISDPWSYEVTQQGSWISVINSGTDSLTLNISKNDTTTSRQAKIHIFSLEFPDAEDSVFVYQYAGPNRYIICSPREQKIAHTGNVDVVFDVTSVNIADWNVVESSLQNWVHLNDSTSPDEFSLTVDPNDLPETRIDTVWLQATDDPEIKDSVLIYQYSGLEHYLLAAPREQETDYREDTLHFDVTAVNISNPWLVDFLEGEEWIEEINSGTDSLSLGILENTDPNSRQGIVRIYSGDFQAAADTVTIYQHAGSDSLLLASPREQKIGHTGSDEVIFEIAAVNVEDWEVITDSLDNWIEVNTPHQLDTLSLKVFPNNSVQTRIDTVWIQSTENNDIKDFVFVFQYSGQNNYLLVAPREQETDYHADVLNFEVAAVNLNDPWEVEIFEGSEWITNIPSGTDLLSLDISKNNSNTTRQGLVRIFSNEFSGVADTVSVYQYAGPDSLLLVSPREQKIAHSGNLDVVFDVTAVNIADWQIIPGNLPVWIEVNLPHQLDELRLNVDPNLSDSTRSHTVWIEATENAEINDFVTIYQYSVLDHYLLAEPREQETDYQEDVLNFNVTAVNLNEPWLVDILEGDVWINNIASGVDLLSLEILENETATSRQGKIRIYSEEFTPAIADTVSVYQYARPEQHILAAPREQKIAHTGNDDVVFDVTSVNIADWNVIESSLQGWVHLNDSTAPDKFSLTVDTNNTLQTRIDTVWVEARGNAGIRDSVLVFQYSNVSPYVLIAPREQHINFAGGELPLPFVITTNLVDTWDFGYDTTWMDVIRQGDSLRVFVDSSEVSVTRNSIIKAWDVNDSLTVNDMVSVFQGSGSDPYILMLPAAYDTIPSDGEDFTIYVYSNLGNYSVEKEPGRDWYEIDTESCSYNDSVTVTVSENTSSYSSRSSYLTFSSPAGDVVKYFYLLQKRSSVSFLIEISGKIRINGNLEEPLADVWVFIGTDSIQTGTDGNFSLDVANGWTGAVIPKGVDHYYDPGNVIFDEPVNEPLIELFFVAIPIIPTVKFNESEIFICAGQTLAPDDNNYPVITVSGTYGPEKFYWLSEPHDPGINHDTTDVLIKPVFTPGISTKYSLVLHNHDTFDTATFNLNVYPVPVARDFDGLLSVCRNQAGVIYTVGQFNEGEYFSWELSGGGTFLTEPKSNIAIIDWGDVPGEYQLSLFTFNEFGCSRDSTSKTIVISSEQAPPKTTVEKKTSDNMLLCSDPDANLYEWGWYTITDGQLGDEYIIPEKNDWYCRLPHEYKPIDYKYFVITHYEGLECGSRSFHNPPVSIDEIISNDIYIFPNPTDGAVNIKFNLISLYPSATLEMFSISGMMVYQQKLSDIQTNSTITINETRYLKPGIYFIRIRSKDIFYNSKIVVQ